MGLRVDVYVNRSITATLPHLLPSMYDFMIDSFSSSLDISDACPHLA